MQFSETLNILFSQGKTGYIVIGLAVAAIVTIVIGAIEVYKGSHYL